MESLRRRWRRESCHHPLMDQLDKWVTTWAVPSSITLMGWVTHPEPCSSSITLMVSYSPEPCPHPLLWWSVTHLSHAFVHHLDGESLTWAMPSSTSDGKLLTWAMPSSITLMVSHSPEPCPHPSLWWWVTHLSHALIHHWWWVTHLSHAIDHHFDGESLTWAMPSSITLMMSHSPEPCHRPSLWWWVTHPVFMCPRPSLDGESRTWAMPSSITLMMSHSPEPCHRPSLWWWVTHLSHALVHHFDGESPNSVFSCALVHHFDGESLSPEPCHRPSLWWWVTHLSHALVHHLMVSHLSHALVHHFDGESLTWAMLSSITLMVSHSPEPYLCPSPWWWVTHLSHALVHHFDGESRTWAYAFIHHFDGEPTTWAMPSSITLMVSHSPEPCHRPLWWWVTWAMPSSITLMVSHSPEPCPRPSLWWWVTHLSHAFIHHFDGESSPEPCHRPSLWCWVTHLSHALVHHFDGEVLAPAVSTELVSLI